MGKDDAEEKQGAEGNLLPPPVIYFGFLVLALIANYVWALPFLSGGIWAPIGLTIVILSLLLAGWSFAVFSRSRTSLDHRKPTTEILSSGPFRYSRNPIYLSLSMLLIGLAIALGNLWILLAAVIAHFLTRTYVIAPEEAFLERKFGEDYLLYKQATKRWI